MHEETGDILGDELMLIKSGGRFLGLWTDYGGAPSGPYLADSVSEHGDTTVLEGHFEADKPWWPFSRAFFLGPRPPASALDTSTTSFVPDSVPAPLTKTAELAEFFGLSKTIPCPGLQPRVRPTDLRKTPPNDAGDLKTHVTTR
jgi:hypothetical protein